MNWFHLLSVLKKAFDRNSFWKRVVKVLTCIVVFCTTYALILPAMTQETQTYCGFEQHTHTEECYETVLNCTIEDSPGHTHDESCYSVSVNGEKELTCGLEESAPVVHSHSQNCSTQVLTCTKTEHEHDLSCYSNPEADLENAKSIQASLPGEYYDDYVKDVIAAARSQVGYTESEDNYQVVNTTEIKGYTRYGYWWTSRTGESHEYDDWSSLFIAFVLNYAGIPSSWIPYSETVSQWTFDLASEEYENWNGGDGYQPGDLIVVREKDTSGNEVLLAGVITEVDEDKNITAVIADLENQVKYAYYSAGSGKIVGWVQNPGNMDMGIMALDEDGGDGDSGSSQTVIPEGAKDFGSYITSVSITALDEHEKETSVDQKEGTYQLTEDQMYLFKINYQLATGVVSKDQRSIYYQLPDNFVVSSVTTGTVYGSDGTTAVGTFRIGTDGKILITFSEEAMNQHSDKVISGYVSFKASGGSIDTGTDTEETINFNDNVAIQINVTDKTLRDHEDLRITKTAGKVDYSTGTIPYTLTVTSKNGTRDNVVIADSFTGLGVYDTGNGSDNTKTSFSIDPDADVVSSEFNDQNFTITMEPMNAGDTYTITYRIKVDTTDLNVSTVIDNTVTATSVNDYGVPLEDKDVQSVPYTQSLISKSGTKNGSVTEWTITINGSGLNLDGYTFDDNVSWIVGGSDVSDKEIQAEGLVEGKDYITYIATSGTNSWTHRYRIVSTKNLLDLVEDGTITLKNQSGGEHITLTRGDLPYTFGSTTDTYKITYTLPANLELGTFGIANVGTITGPDGETGTATEGVGIIRDTDAYTGITKSKGSDTLVKYDNLTDTVVLPWTIKVEATYGEFAAGWTIQDQVEDSTRQWYTQEQIQAITQAVSTALSEKNLSLTFKVAGTPIEGAEGKYSGFTITFTETLPQGASFSFTVMSTASYKDLTNTLEVRNSANINGGTNSTATSYVRPEKTSLVKKRNNGGSGETESSNVKITSVGQKLEWMVTIQFSNQADEGYVITENLPKGLDPDYIQLLGDGAGGSMVLYDNGSCKENVIGDGKYEILYSYDTKTSETANILTIHLPVNLVTTNNLKEIRLLIRMTVSSDYDWQWDAAGNRYGVFENVASLATESGQDRHTDSHTMKVTSTAIQDLTKADVSSADGDNLKENANRYSVTVNPYAVDLVRNSDSIQFVDTYTITYNSADPVTATLDAGSLQIEEVDKDGNRNTVDLDTLTIQVDKTTTEKDGQTQEQHTLTVTLDDEKTYVISYSYILTGDGGTGITAENKASIDGGSSATASSGTKHTYYLFRAAAGATVCGFTILKYDADHYTKTLEGAEFQLYKYNPDSSAEDKFELLTYNGSQKLTTGSDGKISVSPESATDTNITYNTVYKLVETKSAPGYVNTGVEYCFYIYNADTDLYPLKGLNLQEVEIHRLSPGSVIEISNPANSTTLQIQKEWTYESEAARDNDLPSSISVKIYQVENSKDADGNLVPSRERQDNPVFTTVTITEEDGWRLSVPDLPACKLNADTGKIEAWYTYYVEEVNGSLYDVTYTGNEKDGIESGTITITNTVQESPPVVLPSTGGTGTTLFTLTGSILCASAACLAYLLKNRKS